MRYSDKTRRQAQEACAAFERAGITVGFESMCYMIRAAKALHRIAERWCSEEMSDEIRKRTETKERNYEKRIKETAESYGLTAHFDGDPRGFVVKLHAPKGDVFNTWGGAESGYGIG